MRSYEHDLKMPQLSSRGAFRVTPPLTIEAALFRNEDIEILHGHVRPDHVHLLLSTPPRLAPSRVMQAIKEKTSHHLLHDYRKLRRRSGVGTCGVGATSYAAAGT
jgi:REP element-mobilizing transposase RayT